MKFYIHTLAAAAVALTAAAPVLAGGQVAARPGVSLTEAARLHFNRGSRPDDHIASVTPGMSSPEALARLAAAAGLSISEASGLTLEQIVVVKINRESRGDDQQAVPGGPRTKASRSFDATIGHAQLIASAGLTAEQAAGLSLTELAIAKFNRDARGDDRQGSRY